jgi:signal transduction histidine kinase
MRRYIAVYVLLIVIVLSGFMTLAALLKPPSVQELDMVAVNRITQSVEQNWGKWENIEESQYNFIVLNTNGESVFKTDSSLPDTLYGATKACFVRTDITGKGMVMFDTDPQRSLENTANNLRSSVFIAGIVISVAMAIFLIVLYFHILRPFHKLRAFASSIANGNFDVPLPMDRSQVFGAFAESFDIMRQSLQEARQNELALDHSKKELIAAISHDINTPVTSIRLLSELLQVQVSDAGQLDRLKAIESKAEQISSLVNNLLGSTLQELGQFVVTIDDVDSIILGDMLHEEGIEVTNVPRCLVCIDQKRMAQVIGNITGNSRKYAGTAIVARIEMLDSHLQLDINDFGPGAQEPELDILCAKYFRGANAIESKMQGEGLGLYIAKTLMEKMGGDLTCLNRPGGFAGRPGGFTVRLLVKLS